MPNIYAFDRLYRRTETGTGVTGEVVRLQLKPVPAKKLRVLNRVTVEDKTTAYTKLRIGIHNSGTDHYLDELDTPAADELAVNRIIIQLGEGDYFFAELTGTTTGDVLQMTCLGWTLSL